MIPAGWKVVRLGECLTIMHGKNQSQIVDPEGRYPILATGGVIGRTNSYLSNKPSVLIGRKGTIDKPQYMDTPFWTVDTLFYSEIKTGISAKFLFYKFLMVNWKSYNEASGVPSLNASTIENVEMLMPPLEEQEAIAEALSDADAAIESLDALIAKKRDVKQAAMQQLLTGRTRLPGFNADWKEVRLGEYAAFFKGNGLSKSQLIDDGPQQCVHYGELFTHYGPVIETVTSKCVEFEGSFRSLAGDVLMPGSDVTPRGLATASAIKVSDVVLGGDVIVIRTKPNSLHGPFLSNFIRMSKGRVLRLVKGSTVYHIHAKDLADFEVLTPPLKEQEAIAEALGVMDDEIEALTEQVSKLRMVKEGMMQDLLTGKVRLV